MLRYRLRGRVRPLRGRFGRLDNDVGGLDDGNRDPAGLELQLLRGLGAHQRHDRECPHCISTWVITLSLTTLVTNPTKRLRAELPTPSGLGGSGGALVRQNQLGHPRR